MNSKLEKHISPDVFNETYIQTDYSEEAIKQVHKIIENGIYDRAISRKEVGAITIDWINSIDLDDAIWWEKTSSWYCVWIHISDVSEAISIFSPLDIEALHRTTSIYRKDHIINMLPRELSNNILSLTPEWWKKLTISLQIDLDNEGNIKNYLFYESRFENIKRYDYESFWYDFVNPESINYEQLQTLKEISDILRMKRLSKGWILNWDDGSRRLYIWEKAIKDTNSSIPKKISHDIIESFMVLANVTAGQYLVDKKVPVILKRHDSLEEQSYYNHYPNSFHKWLSMKNYTHFTSPIRRYVDIVIHRTIKALHRWEELPYSKNDNKFIATHSNNTRWKIETLGTQIDIDNKWKDFIRKTERRLWRKIEVYDMKSFIRKSSNRSLKLPSSIKKSIMELVVDGVPWFWTWAVGIILLWKDEDLKKLIRKRILEDKVLSPKGFLNILNQTKIIIWEKNIFRVKTKKTESNYSISLIYKWEVIAKSKWTIKRYENEENLKYHCRKKLVSRIFDHFMV